MAAGAWQIFTRAKRKLGTASGGIALDGVFRMVLHTSAASANLLKITNTGISTCHLSARIWTTSAVAIPSVVCPTSTNAS